ncbi:MAG: carboxypeptidase regulatory-like domain-containing protein, partial [Myxococcales bacterium]|nr:carboxypeptidase regulatory-like domain-containing protein [Myxococcales bacterium]
MSLALALVPAYALAQADDGGEDAGSFDAGSVIEDAGLPETAVDAGPVDVDAGTLLPSDAPVAKKPLPKNFVGIVGVVTDAQSGEGLIEATVKVVAGGKKSALTDVDGEYRLKLPPGTYDL